MTGRILFDRGPLQGGTLFHEPHDMIRADTIAEVAPALAKIEAAQADGYWLAGYFSYELGYALVSHLHHLMPDRRKMPLILMGVYDRPLPAPALTSTEAQIGQPRPLWSRKEYDSTIDAVRRYIEAGDCYQINLTFPMEAQVLGDPLSVYMALVQRQQVGEGAFVDLDGPVVLSRSPELFFSVDENRQIKTRPMKGTMPRGATSAEDKAMAQALAASDKNRAENLMIVDLLRNDISRVCQPGSVQVPHLFQIEPYATVFQMTSTVTGTLRDDAELADILTALFPCGSITGAPKIRAMEIIAELEQRPRDIYCGAIGWMDPAGPMRFNVAIRSPIMDEAGMLHLQVGGGIVHDSETGSEWEEAICKSAFLNLSLTG